jgi:hypothetical protein
MTEKLLSGYDIANFRTELGDFDFSSPDRVRIWSDLNSNFRVVPSPLMLGDYYSNLLEAIRTSSVLNVQGIAQFADVLENLLLAYGLVIEYPNDRIFPPKLENKYHTYESLVHSEKKGLRVLVHGAFDPLHVGHMRSFKTYAEFCNQKEYELFVGFDSNEHLSERKGTINDPRPRYPQLGWRMLEASISPYVEGVFVIPRGITEGHHFVNMYQELGIDVLGTGAGNPFYAEYQLAMKSIGGEVVQNHEIPINSTSIYGIHSKSYMRGSILVKGLSNHIHEAELFARNLGYLFDQPDYQWIE